MKLSLSFIAATFAADVCQNCADNIVDFTEWINNDNIVCSRYTDPRLQFSRSACKECKIACKPVESSCPGVSELEAGFWNKNGKKIKTQYIERSKEMANKFIDARRENQFAKEVAKLENLKQKQAEKAAKEANKAAKAADWEAWREEKRQKANEARAAKKAAKQEQKRLNKEAKELRKQLRLEKRALAESNKVLFAFYADMEEVYRNVCPDIHLIKDNKMARSYNTFLNN